MLTVNDKFMLSDKEITSFNQDGFIVLRNLLSYDFIEYTKQISYSSVETPTTNYGSNFNRFKYDVGNDDPIVLELIKDKNFRHTLNSLTNQKLFFLQGLAFELKKNKDTGFPWHVGTQSFGCQHKDDSGYTMWIPFCDINPNKQKGGMKYISKNKISGEFIYQYINLLPDRLKFMKDNGDKIDYEYFNHIKNDIINSKEISKVLDHHSQEDYFSPTDVIFFDKYVLHRSVKLEEGNISSRLAFALRFVDIDSTYDLNRVKLLNYPKREFDYTGSSDFNEYVCSTDGEKLIDSDIFKANRNERILFDK